MALKYVIFYLCGLHVGMVFMKSNSIKLENILFLIFYSILIIIISLFMK